VFAPHNFLEKDPPFATNGFNQLPPNVLIYSGMLFWQNKKASYTRVSLRAHKKKGFTELLGVIIKP